MNLTQLAGGIKESIYLPTYTNLTIFQINILIIIIFMTENSKNTIIRINRQKHTYYCTPKCGKSGEELGFWLGALNNCCTIAESSR